MLSYVFSSPLLHTREIPPLVLTGGLSPAHNVLVMKFNPDLDLGLDFCVIVLLF